MKGQFKITAIRTVSPDEAKRRITEAFDVLFEGRTAGSRDVSETRPEPAAGDAASEERDVEEFNR